MSRLGRLPSSTAKKFCLLRTAFLALAMTWWSGAATAHGQLEFESAPILYGTAPTNDPVVRLQGRLDAGTGKLEFDEAHGYLRSLLAELGIRPSSQVLVHSKTSLQLRQISPSRPRAVYFNDHSYVGWVQGGEVIEVMTTDPVQGGVFYTLPQKREERPRLSRDSGQCLTCHASSRTQGVPGGLVRSLFVDANGLPHFNLGTFTTDHRSPFEERWGGYYVTGTHGSMRHMGNVCAPDREDPDALDRDAGANVTDLVARFDVSRYLTPHSDIVALMVLEHQTQMQNYLTLASYEGRAATHYDRVMNAALERPEDHISDLTHRRIAAVADKLVQYMLFCDEFSLTAPVRGTSDFAKDFVADAPRDRRGRSLRDFDLQTRMFKYPCSYLIYSPSFDHLPEPVKQDVVARLRAVLWDNDPDPKFEHLSPGDRQAIREILTETKPGLWEG